jgi:hypothetical protein
MTISIITENEKASNSKYIELLSKTTIFLRHDKDQIIVDSFEGQGNSYKKREQALITFVMNEEIIFEGTKYELMEILKNNINK